MNKSMILSLACCILVLFIIVEFGSRPVESSCNHLRYRGKVIITDGFYQGMSGEANDLSSDAASVGIFLNGGPFIVIECSKVQNLKE